MAAKKVTKKKTKSASPPAASKKKAAPKGASKKKAAKFKPKPAARKAKPAAKSKAPRGKASKVSAARAVTEPKPKAKKKVVKKKATKKVPRIRLNLKGFREQLLVKQAELLQAYNSAKGDTRDRQSDGTEDYIDYAVSSYDREFLLSLTELEKDQLLLVEAALKRIDSGDFGECSQCSKPIPPKRLEVQPWASYCVRCQELSDQGLMNSDFDDDADDDDADATSDEGEDDDVEGELQAGGAVRLG